MYVLWWYEGVEQGEGIKQEVAIKQLELLWAPNSTSVQKWSQNSPWRHILSVLSSALSCSSAPPPATAHASASPSRKTPSSLTSLPSLCASLWQMGTVCDSRVIGSHPHGVGLCFCECHLTFYTHTHVFVGCSSCALLCCSLIFIVFFCNVLLCMFKCVTVSR